MKKLLYTAVPVATALALPLTACANAFCDKIANCVTVSCYAMSITGCVGGFFSGSMIW